jgi:hypothetical protein
MPRVLLGKSKDFLISVDWNLGDQIQTALSAVGVTKERVEDWVGGPCGCDVRREKLNRLGYWAKRVIMGKTHKAVQYLEEILGESYD